MVGYAGAMAGTRLIQDKCITKQSILWGMVRPRIPFINGTYADINLIDDYQPGILEQVSFIVGLGL